MKTSGVGMGEAWETRLGWSGRLIWRLAAELWRGEWSLRAKGLVFTTLLSLAPLLAVSFSVLKAFGVHYQLEPLLGNALHPLGAKGVEISRAFAGFVENVHAGVLGAFGVALLLYTVVAMIQQLEEALNAIWQLRRERPWPRKLFEFISVILVGPVLILSAAGVADSVFGSPLTQRLMAESGLALFFAIGGDAWPVLLVMGTFTAIYLWAPNTQVHPLPALGGGAAAAVLWHTCGWLFSIFFVDNGNYSTIYSAFASWILFLLWLYVGWLIVFTGAAVAFHLQHPSVLREEDPAGSAPSVSLAGAFREKAGLHLLARLAESAYRGEPPHTAESLARGLQLHAQPVEDLLRLFVAAGLLHETGEEPPCYVFVRPPDAISLQEVIEALRGSCSEMAWMQRLPPHPIIDPLEAQCRLALERSLAGKSLRDLAAGGETPREGASS
ncbi:MAG: YihY family inner membrane protein [Magnetococcales bacterium]|nr:YihY family inner membrane protein [Magnetococcales bacterium]